MKTTPGKWPPHSRDSREKRDTHWCLPDGETRLRAVQVALAEQVERVASSGQERAALAAASPRVRAARVAASGTHERFAASLEPQIVAAAAGRDAGLARAPTDCSQ